jgi:hypothetical protein
MEQQAKAPIKLHFALSLLLACPFASAQDSTAVSQPKPLTISAYAEVYLAHDFDKPANGRRPDFLYNFDRHGRPSLNLGYAKASYTKGAVRANLALAAGTYMESNYAAEPDILGHLLEANLGVRLDRNGRWWLDAGVMPSHIGFEFAVGKDDWTLTRSLVAENSPYFETGVRLGYTTETGDWQFAVLALNGWQRIHFRDGYTGVSIGTQATYKPSDKVTLNHSAFFGTDTPDTARLFRQYHNIYGIFQLDPKLGLIAGVDIGWQQRSPNGKGMNAWASPVAILRYSPKEKWAMAFRAEYYGDPDGVIVATGTPNGFRTRGMSLNVDYKPIRKMMLRVEGRLLRSRDAIFMKDGQAKNSNASIAVSVAVSL